jgi:hypothetical protein
MSEPRRMSETASSFVNRILEKMSEPRRMSETATSFVNRILEKWLPQILVGEAVAVPDDDEEMNWRLFFAHSQDFRGFAADIFTGGENERAVERWTGLRDRWKSTSRELISDLARVWERYEIDLRGWSHPRIGPLLDLLERSQIAGAVVFGTALREFKGYKIACKTNKMIRAYIQNAALLKPHGFSFRRYLASIAPSSMPPRGNVLQAEAKWIATIKHDFYNVELPLANYLICDWLLWFWMRDEIGWFASFKADSVQKKSLAAILDLPQTDSAFVDYCRTLRVPQGFGSQSEKPLPPRLLNECIWMEGNRSTRSKCLN